MQTKDLIFYHGTGRTAAQAILASGARDSLFEEMGAYALGRKILHALRAHAHLSPIDDFKLHHAFTGPGMELSSLWVPALSRLDSNGQSYFEYGHFCATLNIANAYRYAINPYRSEFIQALAEALKVLDHIGGSFSQTLANDYPKIAHAIKNPSPPVVLELGGISRERLLNRRGGSNIQMELELFIDMEMDPGVNAPVDFRIRNVTSDDIVAVHDLCDWSVEEVGNPPWRPDKSKVAAARYLVQDWLAKGQSAKTSASTL